MFLVNLIGMDYIATIITHINIEQTNGLIYILYYCDMYEMDLNNEGCKQRLNFPQSL